MCSFDSLFTLGLSDAITFGDGGESVHEENLIGEVRNVFEHVSSTPTGCLQRRVVASFISEQSAVANILLVHRIQINTGQVNS